MPESESLIKRHAEGVTHNTIGNILSIYFVQGVPLLISWFVAHAASVRGLGLHWIIIVFVVAFAVTTFGINQLRQLLGSGRPITNEPSQLEEERRRYLDLASQKNEISADLTDKRSEVVALSAKIESFKWLHELADAQSKEIRAWVRLEREGCRPETSDLFRAKPYIDFRIVVCNYSVFKVSMTQLHGIIDYDSRPLSGDVHWVSNGITKLAPGERADAVIRLLLDDSADVLRLRNIDSVFMLDKFKVRIETEPPTEAKDLSLNCGGLSVGRIRAQYPKLKMEIANVGVKGYFENTGDHVKGLGSVVNVYLALENTRNTSLVVDQFKLITLINGRHTVAQTGDIRELPILFKGQIQQTGNELGDNLNQCPLRAEPRDNSLQGWLQFVVRDVTTPTIRGTGATVIATDSTGEEHPISFNLPVT